jgi:hypothetical protein
MADDKPPAVQADQTADDIIADCDGEGSGIIYRNTGQSL